MKIALFAETYYPYINGVVMHLKVLHDGLKKLGHEVLIVTADPDAKEHFIKDDVLHCPAKAMKKLYGYALANPLNQKRLDIIRQFDPDIIHIHHEFGIGLSGVKAADKLNKPLVYTLHTMYDEYLFYIVPKPLIPALKKVSHKYEHFLANKATVLTSPSAKAQEFFKLCGIDKAVKLIPNSVQVDRFLPENIDQDELSRVKAELEIKDGQTSVVFVGRLGKEKSVDLLLKYWADFFKDNDKLRLIIIGDGPEADNLKQLSAQLGISNRVVFTGNIANDQIPPYYAACDIFATASLTEMMSISMLEAMAAGLPLIQRYDEMNASQYNKDTGYTFSAPDEFARIVLDVANQTDEQKMSQRQKIRTIAKENGEARLVNYMLELYNSLI